jgi:hypothetical protein
VSSTSSTAFSAALPCSANSRLARWTPSPRRRTPSQGPASAGAVAEHRRSQRAISATDVIVTDRASRSRPNLSWRPTRAKGRSMPARPLLNDGVIPVITGFNRAARPDGHPDPPWPRRLGLFPPPFWAPRSTP